MQWEKKSEQKGVSRVAFVEGGALSFPEEECVVKSMQRTSAPGAGGVGKLFDGCGSPFSPLLELIETHVSGLDCSSPDHETLIDLNQNVLPNS